MKGNLYSDKARVIGEEIIISSCKLKLEIIRISYEISEVIRKESMESTSVQQKHLATSFLIAVNPEKERALICSN